MGDPGLPAVEPDSGNREGTTSPRQPTKGAEQVTESMRTSERNSSRNSERTALHRSSPLTTNPSFLPTPTRDVGSVTARGHCPVCRFSFRLCKDGTVQTHRLWIGDLRLSACQGSRQPPTTEG